MYCFWLNLSYEYCMAYVSPLLELSSMKLMPLIKSHRFFCAECLEFFEKCFVIDIVRTIAGERHTDQTIDAINRTIAHVDRLVC